MTLSDISIRRPVLTWVMTASLVVFGVLGYVRLGIDQFPDMEFPTVVVSAILEGATPEGLEEDVTDVLEEQLNSIASVASLRSTSSPGEARIDIEFELGTDLDVAVQDVRDKVSQARYLLPPEVEPPLVRRINPGDQAIIWAPLQSDRPVVQTSEIVRRLIKPEIETIAGVASVIVFGRLDRNIRIWLDGEALRARGLAVGDVLTAIRRQHVEIPAGRIESEVVEYAVKTDAEFASIEALENLIIAHVDGAPIHLVDVARVSDGAEDVRNVARYDGERIVGIGIRKQSGSNTVAIADGAYERIVQLNEALPSGLRIFSGDALIDFSKPIRESVAETQFALVFGALLAVLTVFAFLRRWRSTLIVAAAIPLSLITSFGFTWLFGFTLNTMTLLAMALAVGVVIDDAIVVLENIERHREQGMESFEAAHKGTRQIAFAATAATVAIAVVFLPVFFIEGIVRNFLGEFGVTVASAVLISLFVALTLTPMLAARIPPAKEREHGSIYHYLEVGFEKLEASYRGALEWALANRTATLGIAVASLVVALWFGSQLGSEFFPPSDQGLFIVDLETPPGSSLKHTEDQVSRVEKWLLAQPELSGLFSAAGGSGPGHSSRSYEGIMAGTLVPKRERERTVQELIQAARKALAGVPGVKLRLFDMSGMYAGPGSHGDFSVELRGNASLEELDALSDEMSRALEARGGFVDLHKSLQLGLPEVRVIPDREKAAALGVDATTLATTVRAMIGGIDVASFKEAGRRFDIRLRLEKEYREDPAAIQRLYIRAPDGEVVELRNLVRLETGAAPTDITRSGRQRSVSIYANLDGKELGQAIADAQAVAAEVLPEGITLELAGQAEEFRKSVRQFTVALGLAILVIYLVLAAQFESFVHPFTVMLALPLAMVGALGALYLGGMTLNLFSTIGILMLFGLVTKNSILLVDYANQLRAEGLDKVAAMRRAAPIRMRPVLMTAISMIFGVLPAALGLGPGAENRRPMAVATAAGMMSSTMLTLLVVPVFYIVLDDAVEWLKRLPRRLLRRAEPAAELRSPGG